MRWSGWAAGGLAFVVGCSGASASRLDSAAAERDAGAVVSQDSGPAPGPEGGIVGDAGAFDGGPPATLGDDASEADDAGAAADAGADSSPSCPDWPTVTSPTAYSDVCSTAPLVGVTCPACAPYPFECGASSAYPNGLAPGALVAPGGAGFCSATPACVRAQPLDYACPSGVLAFKCSAGVPLPAGCTSISNFACCT